MIPTLTTERLVLRPYRDEDFDAFAAMWSEAGVVQFVGGKPFSREDSWNRFLRNFGMWEHMGFGFFAVEERATGTFVGEVGFQERMRDIVPSMEGTVETGWAFRSVSPRQGFCDRGGERGARLGGRRTSRAALHRADRCRARGLAACRAEARFPTSWRERTYHGDADGLVRALAASRKRRGRPEAPSQDPQLVDDYWMTVMRPSVYGVTVPPCLAM